MQKKFLFGVSSLMALAMVAGATTSLGTMQETVGVHAVAAETGDEMPDNWAFTKAADGDTAKHVYDLAHGHYVKIVSTSNGLSNLRTVTPITGGKTYNVGFRVKTTGSARLYINIVEYKGNDATIASEIGGMADQTDWVHKRTRFSTRSDTTQIAVELAVRGEGEVHIATLTINEGVAEDANLNNMRFFTGPEGNATTGKAITDANLSPDGFSGKAAKLTADTGLYMPWNVKNQFTGRFTLRFRYRYVDQKAASGKSGSLKLLTRLDTIDAAGNRAYYGTAPKAGWTNYSRWETYEYQIIAKPSVAEPVYVTLHASLQDATKESADYYLIDDVEVLNEKGECVMSGGTFDNVTTDKGDTLLGFVDGGDSVNDSWTGANFVALPKENYIYDGFNGTRAVHLNKNQSIGLSFPVLPRTETFTLSLKYRKTENTHLFARIDHYNQSLALADQRQWYAGLNTSELNQWADASYTFRTVRSDGAAGEALDVSYLVLAAGNGAIDLDSVSLKDSTGLEYIPQGNFNAPNGGGAQMINNAATYLQDDGTIVYTARRKISNSSTYTAESYIGIDEIALGIQDGSEYTLGFEYLGGINGDCASVSDAATWIQGNQNAATTWTEKSMKFTGNTGRQIRIYAVNGWSADATYAGAYRAAYIRNISIKDSSKNELFTPYANGKSVLPQGAFFVNGKNINIDALLDTYFWPRANKDYTSVAEADRQKSCQDNYKEVMSKLGYLSDEDRAYFNTAEEYANVRAILEYWRAASASSSVGTILKVDSNSTAVWVVASISLVSIVASTVLLLRHKKKQN